MVVFFVCGVFAQVADAGETWYSCTIDSVGVSGGSGYVRLTDAHGLFDCKWVIFEGSETDVNRLLAVALSASSSSATVSVRFDLSESYPSCSAIMMCP